MAAGFYGRTFVVVFIELVLVILTQCCVKNTTVTHSPEEMVARSDYVLRGIVKEKIRPDPRTPAIQTSYGVKFQVKCIYKGDSTSEPLKNEIITIAGAGVVDPSCYTMEVKDNEEYTVFLNKEGSHIVPSYGAPEGIETQDLYELVVICDMIPYRPGGGKIVDDCPSADPPPGCIKYVFPTEPPTVKTTAPQTTAEPTSEPAVTYKDGTKDGDKKNIKTNDNGGATTSFNLTSIFSIFICLFSSLLMS